MKKKKILITGAAGFIGSHLTEYLSKKKYKIIAFDRYNSDNNWGWLENNLKKKNIEFVLGDIRDYDSVYNVVKRSDVEHICCFNWNTIFLHKSFCLLKDKY